MSSPSSSIEQGEDAQDILEITKGGSDEKTNDSDKAQLPVGPPYDLNNFPFTFENASHSINIEPDSDPSKYSSYKWDGESITSSVTAYREENGRTYHAYSDGSYHYPNDSLELERLDWQYICLKRLFNGKNYFAPWSQERPPKRILDLATGTGMWAIEMAEEFESSMVVGTDLSPIQPEFVPPNVQFYIHDARLDEWWWPDPFDYIHIRMALGAWEDFEVDVAQKAFDHLEPGGWFEAQELLPTLGCDDNSMPDDWPPNLLFNDLEDCARREHRPLDIAKTYKQGLINAGFVDVTEQVYKIPISGWAKSKNWKTLGDLWNVNCLDAIQGVAMALLHRARGLKRHQIEIHLMDTRRALSDKSVHAYQRCYVVLGRKPGPNEAVVTTSIDQ
ncbi:S-adenosyl-L-methionine-dependent methyltransferase [Xylaria flabelliformis]|nr:S-adenosyl-L-methionine-dependent methyltransferase [Xylaria flabelliformis]